MTLYEVTEIANVIVEAADSEVDIIFGAVIDNKLAKNELQVTVVAAKYSKLLEKKEPHLMGIIEYPGTGITGDIKEIEIPPWIRCNTSTTKSQNL